MTKQEAFANIKTMAWRRWSEIADDLFAEDTGESMSRETVIEVVRSVERLCSKQKEV